EIAADPRTGVQRRELLLWRMLPEIVADADRFEPVEIVLESCIECAKETFAAVAEKLPRIFAIENDGHEAAIVYEIGNMPQMKKEMHRGLRCLVSRRVESNEIAERPLPEHSIPPPAILLRSE